MRQNNNIIANLLGWMLAAALAMAVPPAYAAGTATDFNTQCPLLLAQAPWFAQVCVANARPWGRVFNYEPEQHSAYMGPVMPGSNFALGCTLDATHKIDNLGIYYTMNSNNFDHANSAPMGYIDFNGNFGVVANNNLINFIAIRKFRIDPKMASQFYGQNMFPGCDTSNLPKGSVPDPMGYPVYVSTKGNGNSLSIVRCIEIGACDKETEYSEIGQEHQTVSDIVIAGWAGGKFFIEDDGAFLVSSDEMQRYCPNFDSAYSKGRLLSSSGPDIIEEACLTMIRAPK